MLNVGLATLRVAMSKSKYPACEALDPCFEIMRVYRSMLKASPTSTLSPTMLYSNFFMNFRDGHAKRAAVKISLHSILGTDATSDSTVGIHCSCILPTMGGW